MLASMAERKQLRILQDAKIVQIERKTKFIWIFLRCSLFFPWEKDRHYFLYYKIFEQRMQRKTCFYSAESR